MIKSLSLAIVFLLVGCQNNDQSRNASESENSGNNEQTKEAGAADKKTADDKTPQVGESTAGKERTFFRNVYGTPNYISGCIEVVSSLSEPKADLTIQTFIGQDTAGPWAVGTCKESLGAKDGSEETYFGRCDVDPAKKIQGPGVSNEPSRFIAYASVYIVPEAGTDPAIVERNKTYRDTNGSFFKIDKAQCEALAYQATTFVVNQALINRLKVVNLFAE